MIKLRFVTSKSLLSQTIRNVTWSPFSHVEFCLPEGYLGAQIGGGVAIRPLNYDTQMSSELFGTINCDDDTTKKVIDFAKSQIGKPYDTSAIFAFLVHHDITDDSKWFCSELVAAAFNKAGMPLLNISKVNRVTPGMLLISPYIKYDVGYPLFNSNFTVRF